MGRAIPARTRESPLLASASSVEEPDVSRTVPQETWECDGGPPSPWLNQDSVMSPSNDCWSQLEVAPDLRFFLAGIGMFWFSLRPLSSHGSYRALRRLASWPGRLAWCWRVV